jgi:hypothetical protein
LRKLGEHALGRMGKRWVDNMKVDLMKTGKNGKWLKLA